MVVFNRSFYALTNAANYKFKYARLPMNNTVGEQLE